jgi:Antitoxin Xre/MbcA/ParS C-terminal toxin-binding domain
MTDVSPLHALDHRLLAEILQFAAVEFAEDLEEEADALQTHPAMSPQFAGPWVAYVSEFYSRSLVDWFLTARGRSLRRDERKWLEAQRKGWLSIWEVVAVDRGRSIDLRDVLTHEERRVQEVSASKTVEVHHLLLTRVVDAGSTSLICGMHSVALDPIDGAAVVESVRKLLRRKTAVTPDRLREPRVAWRMLLEWSKAVDHSTTPPRLQNKDGDPILLTVDRWKFDRARSGEVVARLAKIPGASPTDDTTFDFIDANDILTGHVEVTHHNLNASTNSIARADALRAQIESACEGLLRSHIRSHQDPLAQWDEAPAPSSEQARPSSPEIDSVISEMKERHYAEWLTKPLPALHGKTPLEAARTKSGRTQLEALVKNIEMIESHMPAAERYDVRKLREALGLSHS